MQRFAPAVASLVFCPAAIAAAACDTPAHHALDFWLGRWVVKDAGKRTAASSAGRGAASSSSVIASRAATRAPA